jgi:hypothetical protein
VLSVVGVGKFELVMILIFLVKMILFILKNVIVSLWEKIKHNLYLSLPHIADNHATIFFLNLFMKNCKVE